MILDHHIQSHKASTALGLWMCLLMLCISILPAKAALRLDDDGNYIVATKEDLKLIANTPTYWKGGLSFVQYDDIDLEGEEIMPIGREHVPFTGVYDGGGHTISNGVIYWDYFFDGTMANYTVGIFGYLYGTASQPACIKNLNINNISVTRKASGPDNVLMVHPDLEKNERDVKLGILVGLMGEFADIHNITITNSRINDGGKATTVRAMMVGGVVGDIQKNTGYNLMDSKNYRFDNIFANVDIDLGKCDRWTGTDYPQMYVGGIAGRLRNASDICYVPDNTVYTGTIIAPWASESPTVSNMRSTLALNGTDMVKCYAGNIRNPGKILYQESNYSDIIKTRLYYNYKAWNSADANATTAVEVTESNTQAGMYGTRTFTSNKNGSNAASVTFTVQKEWAKVQGVNFGTLADPRTDEAVRSQMLAMWQTKVTEAIEYDGVETPKYTWVWDAATSSFKLTSNVRITDMLKAYIIADDVNNVYRLQVAHKYLDTEFDDVASGTVQWESATNLSSDEWTPITGANGFTVPLNRGLFYRAKWTYGGVTFTTDYVAPTRTIYVFNRHTNDEYNRVFADGGAGVYKLNSSLYPEAGNDANDGLTPEKAVKTMERAYQLLDDYGYMSTNTIVVMGYYRDEDYLLPWHAYNKPATLTGTDNQTISHGTIGFARKQDNKLVIDAASELYMHLQAPLTLRDIDILRHWTYGEDGTPKPTAVQTSGMALLICNYFDLTIDDNVCIVNFPYMPSENGLPANITSVSPISIVGGNQDNNTDHSVDPIKYGSDLYPTKKGFYTQEGRTVLNIRSGCFGRIICCARNADVHDVSHNISGSYQTPNRITLNVNIKDDIDIKGGIEYSKYGKKLAADGTGKFYYTQPYYSHNIGLIAGGQTDGSAWGDVEMNIYAGYVARIITSNITYGRKVGEYPTDSYYGRSTLNIYGDVTEHADGTISSTTMINEIFGGNLGRLTATDRKVQPYFYGKSIVNLYGGYIGKYTAKRINNANLCGNVGRGALINLANIVPNIYGAGSGGVTGLGDDNYHTTDPYIAYIDNTDNKIKYGDYATLKANGKMPVMTMLDGEKIDLEKSECYVNLYSGIIQASVYGGGYGYTNNIVASYFAQLPSDIGALYGDSYVRMHRHPDYKPTVVQGNIYGSGAGDDQYAVAWNDWAVENPTESAEMENPFLHVATQYGNTYVTIDDGTVGDINTPTTGDVYGGSMGIVSKKVDSENIAALYGKTNLVINGGTIYGNIYGGSQIANIRKRATQAESGNTTVTINDGIIGNNIFGGSKGIDTKLDGGALRDAKATIDGSAYVYVNGGRFIDSPYKDINNHPTMVNGRPLNIVYNREYYRTFNIYGGGNQNCDIKGDANVDVRTSLLYYDGSIVPMTENDNTDPLHIDSDFYASYMDITFRNFCVYGGGFGEKTNVLNTNVYVNISENQPGLIDPHGFTLHNFLRGQSFFDIAGGGYSGDVGHWANIDGFPVEDVVPKLTIADMPLTAEESEEYNSLSDAEKGRWMAKKFDNFKVSMYHHYEGGNCNVTIDGYTFARKIIGGGFYGSCNNTNTHVRCGSLRQVYGGSLLGYVHNKAYLQFGNRTEDFIATTPSNQYEYDGSGVYNFDGNIDDVPTAVWDLAADRARSLNSHIFITENIYGGNDVKGIIGTTPWQTQDNEKNYGIDQTDGGPLWYTDVDKSEQKGIVFNIYGGTFMGDVYSAGNGHYRGYYVPEWVRYNDGPARMYRTLRSSVDPTKTAKAYRSRPMVGSVNVNLRGNSENDYITILGNFFGGGRECSIGQYNTFLPMEDPRRLMQGGHLHVNMGGHVHIDGNVYLGAEGALYARQDVVPADIDIMNFDGSTSAELSKLGDVAYDHWYYNSTLGKYVPGYPAPGEVDGNFGMTGEHMFRGYMKNIEMEGDVELTFYRYLYERDKVTGKYVLDPVSGDRIRRHWIPGELAMVEYDATDIRMGSFFLGGLCGSMTNNNVMIYNYTTGEFYDEKERDKHASDDLEMWGPIYRIALPSGVTIDDKVVMGSQDASPTHYKYNADYRGYDTDQTIYRYNGGMVTHSAYAFDLIVYNDVYHTTTTSTSTWRDLPEDFYKTPGKYVTGDQPIATLTSYTMKDGTEIYPYSYNNTGHYLRDGLVAGARVTDRKFALAVTMEAGKPSAFIGPREKRRVSGLGLDDDDINANRMTVSKLTCAAEFALKGSDRNDPSTIYGGNIYGGCYNSGLVTGDVVLNIGSNLIKGMLPEGYTGDDRELYYNYAGLEHNIGRIFGGGYGSGTTIDGDTYVNLIRNLTCMNVFGGGMQGNVTGSAYITYIGTEKNSAVHGSIYGGGLRGAVGTDGVTELATSVRLFSGNVRNVYGGSCMGDLYGRAYVELCDEVLGDLTHFDYQRFLKSTFYQDWGASRLIAGNVFGGNDIAGNIHYTAPATATPDKYEYYTTSVYIHEIQETEPDETKQEKTTPGSVNGYNGFPLVGNLYGGGNGNYGTQGTEGDYKGKYSAGQVLMATGVGTNKVAINLSDAKTPAKSFDIPNVDKAFLKIEGGSVVNGYGGGDMSTISDDVRIHVQYPEASTEARAGFLTSDELQRVWRVFQFSAEQQKEEVSHINDDGNPVFDFQIFKLFGGNNNADMAIQPSWVLNRGYIGSLYSGGNFGKMTYYQAPDGTTPEKGLTLRIDSPNINIDYVYGGGRVGDIDPTFPVTDPEYKPSANFYGATLQINQGIIGHVYGGNDVAGYIHYGTNVELTGAISGDVYCAGNGNYMYKYDRTGTAYDGTNYDYSGTRKPVIREAYDYSDPDNQGARYFILPAKAEYGFVAGSTYEASDAITVLAINSYRPHVERTKLRIAGSEDNHVWVRGKVYCGGNSSSIVPKYGQTIYDVKFDIGSHVTLNGVFMGSNGEALSMGETMQRTERLNALEGKDLDLTAENTLSRSTLPKSDWEVVENKTVLYPTLLDIYMRAVEVVNTPDQFEFDPDVDHAFIGDFCLGGNRGSMMTDRRIELEFPSTYTIYGRIIGGCMDANVTYRGVTHIGGLTKPLDTTVADYDGTKVALKIKSHFMPLFINYPDNEMAPPISMKNNFVDADGKSIMIRPEGSTEYIPNPAYTGKKYYANGQCNIYGGCFTSGTTIGNVELEVYSDMLNYDHADTSYDPIDKEAVMNSMKDKSWRAFTVVGGGYGANTAVHGNIHVAMVPGKVTSGTGASATTTVTHPSAATIFGGSQEGLVVGSTMVEMRDGKILANLYGASEAARMYGSTHVIVGYPKYYRVKKSGIYGINRIDYLSEVSKGASRDEKGKIVVTRSVGYHEDDLVPASVYETIYGRVADASANGFKIGADIPTSKLDGTVTLTDCFEPVISKVDDPKNTGKKYDHIVPQDYGVTWDDITIWIGDQASNTNPDAKYYGAGNIYGGGFIPNSSDVSLVGEYTVMRYTPTYNRGASTIGFGGNTSVMVWDNNDNADYSIPICSDDCSKNHVHIKDHVHIGTGRFKQVATRENGSKKGLFEKITRINPTTSQPETAYIYQTSGRMDATKDVNDKFVTEYYEKEADGGLYGAGRKVFVEGFTAVDLAYYGYAGSTPQKPKLLNTIQRADVVKVTDCCMELVGASDFTVDNYKDIYYAINRVGELRMESSLSYNDNLDPGYVATDDPDGVRLHTKARSRNYMALYNKTNHLGAFRSNWNLDRKYHDANGVISPNNEKETGYGYWYPYEGSGIEKVESYVNRKHRYIDLYNAYLVVKAKVDANETYTLAELTDLATKYQTFTGEPLNMSAVSLADKFEAVRQAYEQLFRQRNMATSANMIGISSGYELSFEGLACQRGEPEETRYYGPAYGVTEIKLLTTVSGMGGGYVYALNHHYDASVDEVAHRDVPAGWCNKWGHDFLQTTGNFVFPGANYMAKKNGVDERKQNFIIDDCFDHFDPINHGFYGCEGEARVITRMPALADAGSSGTSAINVNSSHEVHYWYVSGNTYVYNVTVTGFTADSSPDDPRKFYLSNENDMLNLSNIKDGTKIRVTDVTWFDHEPGTIPTGEKCDISDLNKEYQLYLTVGHSTRNEACTISTAGDEIYSIRVPRVSYELATDETTHKYINRVGNPTTDLDHAGANTTGVIVDPNPSGDDFIYKGTYTEGTTTKTNVPRLGLCLVDGQKNRFADADENVGIEYYNKYLKPDHYVQVTIVTQNGTDEEITYVLNIDIRYLLGPALFGKINIENCALPGEYIYVNANDVEVVMDEMLGVAEQKWRMYPNDADGNRIVNTNPAAGENDPHIYIDLDTKEYTIENTEKEIHIPAYYYMNGWEVAYLVTANGEHFESKLPHHTVTEVKDSEDNVIETVKTPIEGNRLEVHNYHRMKPMYNGKVIDLRLVPGARIYIENQADMQYFFEYMDKMAYDDDALKANTSYLRQTVPGSTITMNPRYGKGLNFYQQEHLKVPTTSEYTQVNPITIEGAYHGNGHWMIIPVGASINITNGTDGKIYNTGFVSDVDNVDTNIYDHNLGTMTNCFYFSHTDKGTITNEGTLVNCYQNRPVPTDGSGNKIFKPNELMELSTAGFRYGQVAYNLNGFYLQKRHKLLHEGTQVDNVTPLLYEKDTEVRGSTDPTVYPKYSVQYIEDMFSNGDYRYAYYSAQLFGQFTEALRTSSIPNYFDGLNERANGNAVSKHKYTHDRDTKRWCDTHKCYHPIFDTDYLFFGENLQYTDPTVEHLPELYTPQTRVYRVGGYYGDQADKGYFLNMDAWVNSPKMTAIDFVGYRDRDRDDYLSQMDATTMWINTSKHQIYCPPTIDVPWTEDAVDGMHVKFNSFGVDADQVTHNLLIYTHDTEHAREVMSSYHYTDAIDALDLGKSNNAFANHSEESVKAHHVIDYTSGPRIYGDYMHLVDAHDFNAPVAFGVKEAWYVRKPHGYADDYTVTSGGIEYPYKSDWEGICLPFDVRKVYAANTQPGTAMGDMGEITHFFDDDTKNHEYWLRRLQGYDATRSALLFMRPTAENESPGHDTKDIYVYTNTKLHDLYMQYGYNEDHDALYHYDDNATTESRTMSGYRYFTHNMPYVVTYPGKRYYEFDLSGEFYKEKDVNMDASTPATPQKICYLANGKADDDNGLGDGYIRIPVTDETPMVAYEVNGTGVTYTMRGTFAHVTTDQVLRNEQLYNMIGEDETLYVLDVCKVNTNHEVGTEEHKGEIFSEAEGNVVVLPFRTYITSKATTPTMPAPLRIGQPDSRSIEEIIEEIDPEQQPADEEQHPSVRVWVEGKTLVIDTPYDLETNIYNVQGQTVRRIRAYEGINRYSGLPAGFYITLRTKVRIPF